MLSGAWSARVDPLLVIKVRPLQSRAQRNDSLPKTPAGSPAVGSGCTESALIVQPLKCVGLSAGRGNANGHRSPVVAVGCRIVAWSRSIMGYQNPAGKLDPRFREILRKVMFDMLGNDLDELRQEIRRLSQPAPRRTQKGVKA